MREKKDELKECTPVCTPIPDAPTGAHINVRDPCRSCLLLVRINKTVRSDHELVVRTNIRIFVANENEARQTAFPLRRAVDGCEGGGMYGLRGVVRAGREALQDWILPVSWLEYGEEEIKVGLECPWWGGNGYVSWRRWGVIHVGWWGRSFGGARIKRSPWPCMV